MNTPRALLIPAFLALLTACGGGGDDAPEPAVLWEDTARRSAAGPAPFNRWWVSFTPAPVVMSRRARGELCISGTWRQTISAPGQIELQVEAFNFNGVGQVNLPRNATAAGTVEIPFRYCRPAELVGQQSHTLEMRMNPLSALSLGAYSVEVRWQFIGSYV